VFHLFSIGRVCGQRRPSRRIVSQQGLVGASYRLILFDLVFFFGGVTAALGQEGATPPHWIWYPTGKASSQTPAESRYFRKSFFVKEPSRLVLDATADNAFTLYLDGKPVATGEDWHTTQSFETKLAIGPHVLAAVASNEAPGPAGFLVRGGVLPLGQNVPIHTNSSWKTSGTVPAGDDWTKIGFDDSNWVRAADLGSLGSGPWGALATGQDGAERFRVPPGFRVAMAASPSVTGSVVAFTFDPEGVPCVSIEGGPIARLIDDNKDGLYDRREVIETQVRNCQGLAFIRGRLFVVGRGPKGDGVYRLGDSNKDGVFEVCDLIRGANGGMGEHGPHAIAQGPDGRLYYNNGNHAHLKPPIDPGSPVNVAYEGELLPHYNDPTGHAAGIRAPGGEIFRSDDDGKTWKRVVAGFRNEYDFAFNADGELFTFDADMEYDVGLPWYRPVRVNHCPIGAEFGWRNGSGKWPVYYFDSLPGVLDVGRGSPTGVTFYQARQFPEPFHDSFLICDWSQGRILAVQLQHEGASYAANATELVSGQPLNCTDIETGPDGAVYFTTGGRGTQGGLFRVSWSEAKPSPRPDHPLNEALEIDSPLSSFAQKRISMIQKQLGPTWGPNLEKLARVDGRPSIRVRALDLLAQFGPPPSDELLLTLATDQQDATVRARAVGLLGQRSSATVRDALEKALGDHDAFVRRHACEALMQQPRDTIPIRKLMPLLADPDRWIRFAARKAIEHGDLDKDRAWIMDSSEPRPLVEGMLALVRACRLDEKQQDDVLRRLGDLLTSRRPLEPDLTCDLLRLIELTYLLGPLKAEAPASARLRPVLLGLFSTSLDSSANRELARLLAFLDEPRAVSAILQHQATVPDHAAQIHDAYCLRAMKQGWTPESKQRLWAWYDKAANWEGGYSFRGYLDMMIQNLVALLDPQEKEQFLSRGDRFPFPTRVLVRTIDLASDPRWLRALASLCGRLHSDKPTAMESELRGLIIEKLGRSDRPEVHATLRDLYRKESGQRDVIARAIASHPEEEDLSILVATLDSRDLNTTSLVVRGLDKLKSVPAGPEALGNLIRLARRVGSGMSTRLNSLASRWTGTPSPKNARNYEETLTAWEAVYRQRFPSGPSIAESEPTTPRMTSYDLPLLAENVLRGHVMKTASIERGQKVIERAKCLDCHKFGSKGEGLGPDLTTVNSRFQPLEILESIVEPSKVISDQYKPVTVATSDGKVYNGMPVVIDGPNLVLLLPDGTKATIPKTEIDQKKESIVSVMPAGLLNTLNYQEIADMLALFNSMPRVEVPAVNTK
jgi:putative heme-binding domain-containing protein